MVWCCIEQGAAARRGLLGVDAMILCMALNDFVHSSTAKLVWIYVLFFVGVSE